MSTELRPDIGYERRNKPRIYKPFHASVQGVGEDGKRFQTTTVLRDMSSTGVYFTLDHHLQIGAKISLTIRLSTSESDEVEVGKVAVEGVVVRAEPQRGGACGLAIIITKHRFVG